MKGEPGKHSAEESMSQTKGSVPSLSMLTLARALDHLVTCAVSVIGRLWKAIPWILVVQLMSNSGCRYLATSSDSDNR